MTKASSDLRQSLSFLIFSFHMNLLNFIFPLSWLMFRCHTLIPCKPTHCWLLKEDSVLWSELSLLEACDGVLCDRGDHSVALASHWSGSRKMHLIIFRWVINKAKLIRSSPHPFLQLTVSDNIANFISKLRVPHVQTCSNAALSLWVYNIIHMSVKNVY
jgi:hypothetical protein